MDPGPLFSALDSDLRREIMMILHSGPRTVTEVLESLIRRKYSVKYRETVYRALEKLSDAGLIEKYYKRDRGLCYELVSSKITIQIDNNSIMITQSEK